MSLHATSDSDPPAVAGFAPIVLETDRLRLRPCVRSDAAALFTLYSDAETMRFWSSSPWTDPAEGLRKVQCDEEDRVAGTALGLGLECRATGALIGTCALHAFQHANRRCEIGYLLAPAEWGKGLMQEALRPLLTHGFGVLGLHRVEADIDPDNLTSARILERLGFRLEGRLRERWLVAGRWSDSSLHALLADEWSSAVDQA